MKDKEFLQWIHGRLEFNHAENKDVDYMHKLRAIINDYPEEKITPNVCSFDPEINTEWISVKDILPILENDPFEYFKEIDVIVYNGIDVFPAECRAGRMPHFWCDFGEDAVTHWMPLPEPPK